MISARRVAVALVSTTLAATAVGALAPAQAAKSATAYKNCTALNHAYPHGVGRPGAHDHTSGTPVTNFKRSAPLYNANTKSDRDKDGIACEKA